MPTPLKRAFFESGRTQREVAAEIGKDPADLSRIVNGMHCDDVTQQKIADALGMKKEALFGSEPTEMKAAA